MTESVLIYTAAQTSMEKHWVYITFGILNSSMFEVENGDCTPADLIIKDTLHK